MKLIYAPPSPFARKALVLAHEANLLDEIELVSVAVLPTTRDPIAHAHNPLGKIPTLVLASGQSVFDSRVICEFLNARSRTRSFIPAGESRYRALTAAALADGVLDAALSIRYESAVRPEERRWPEWIAGQRMKISQALAWMEKEIAFDETSFDISHINAACALGYLDFRISDLPWRDSCPRLADFYGRFTKRESMVRTAPN